MSNDAGYKGCLYRGAFVTIVVILSFWVIVGIVSFSTTPFVLATALVPLGSLILTFYKRSTGGLLIIFSGFLPLIIMANTLKDDFYSLGMMVLAIFVTLPLFMAGIIIYAASSKEWRRELAEIENREGILPEPRKGETFNYIVKLCPYCGSANIKSTIVDKANTPEEKKTQGFTEKYLFDCDNCKSTWFAVEK